MWSVQEARQDAGGTWKVESAGLACQGCMVRWVVVLEHPCAVQPPSAGPEIAARGHKGSMQADVALLVG